MLLIGGPRKWLEVNTLATQVRHQNASQTPPSTCQNHSHCCIAAST
jgi:hypothetical protein